MALSLATFFYPELRSVAPVERPRLLRHARRAPFDVLELLGMAAVLVGAALAGTESADGIAAAAAAVLLAPFFVRRTRRALRALLQAR
jgi:hypothetical protein